MLSPEMPLDLPVDLRGDRAKIVFSDRVPTCANHGQIENCFLKVWGKVEQVHDLGDAGTGDVAHRGEIGLCRDGSFPNQGIEADR